MVFNVVTVSCLLGVMNIVKRCKRGKEEGCMSINYRWCMDGCRAMSVRVSYVEQEGIEHR